MSESPSPALGRRSVLLILCAFIGSRIAYFAGGIRFDLSPLNYHWQLIDTVLMRTDLLRSLFYLHMQPPGFNLVIGLVVKLVPHYYGAVLQVLYLVMDLSIGLLLLLLMLLLGVTPVVARALTALFVISPGSVLFANIVAYECPVLLLLLASATCLLRLYRQPSRARAFTFFACLFGLMMIRNQFHLIYYLAVMAAVLCTLPTARRVVGMAAGVFLIPILTLHVKNWFLFGIFSLSTWAGMSTGVVTTYQLAPQECEALIARGVISPLARIPPFSPLADYRGMVELPAKIGIPVLDQETTSTGHPNFNNPAYLRLHSLYTANSRAVLLHYPAAYLRSQAIGWFAYFLPASELHYFDTTRPVIGSFERAFNIIVFGQLRHAESRKNLRAIKASGNSLSLILYTGIVLMILLPVLVVWGCTQVFLHSYRRRWRTDQLAALVFALFTIIFVTGVSNTLSTFENNRYRFPLDGFYITLLGLMLTHAAAARELRGEARFAGAPASAGRC